MTLPNDVEMPTYVVYRNIQPGQAANLAAPLAFFPPLGSDELFDALRAKYPHLKTHSERVGQASLDFFYEEDLTDQATFSTQFSTPQTSQSTTVSPWEASLPSFCSEASTWSSPEGFGPATPSSSPQTLPLSRQQSRATTAPFAASGEASPPDLHSMTTVFSLANAVQPKQRIRRKMTESEKAEYRKRRIVKACDKCAKRKRKCTHNSEELHRVDPSHMARGNSKASNLESRRPHVPRQQLEQRRDQPPLETFMDFDGSSGTDPMSLFEDFDTETILPDMTTDFNLDDFLAAPQPQWLWSDTPDWTLLDPVVQDNAAMHGRGLRHQYVQFQEVTLFDEMDFLPDLSDSQGLEINHTMRHDDANTAMHQQLRSHNIHERNAYVDPSLISDSATNHNRRGSSDDERHRDSAEGLIQHGKCAMNSRVIPVQRHKAVAKTASDDRTCSSASSLTDLEQLQESAGLVARAGFGGRRLLESDVADPQSDRNEIPAKANIGLGLNKAAGSSKGMLQQGGIKSKKQGRQGLTSIVDPSTQLFMLKRRLTRATQGGSSTTGSMLRLQTIPRLQTHPSQPSMPNAGVFGLGDAQLLILHGMTISSHAHDTVSASTDAPVHTRPHSASMGTPSSSIPSHADLSIFAVCEERLCDHIRRWDHFSRSTALMWQACKMLAVVGCFLVVLANLSIPVQSLSMVLLALATPAHDRIRVCAEGKSSTGSGALRHLETPLRYLRCHAGKVFSSASSLRPCRGSQLAMLRWTEVPC